MEEPASDAGKALSAAIVTMLDEWLRHGYALDARQINSGSAPGGCCSDFAAEVMGRMGRSACDLIGVFDVGIDGFQVVIDENFDAGRPFDRALLARSWPKVIPPGDLSWDDLDRLSEDASFSGGTHIWLTLGGMHYDSETPQGTENLFDLPFFRRVIESWIAARPGMAHV